MNAAWGKSKERIHVAGYTLLGLDTSLRNGFLDNFGKILVVFHGRSALLKRISQIIWSFGKL
jgi:hypothetical protein